jgi:hypothetical protein
LEGLAAGDHVVGQTGWRDSHSARDSDCVKRWWDPSFPDWASAALRTVWLYVVWGGAGVGIEKRVLQ